MTQQRKPGLLLAASPLALAFTLAVPALADEAAPADETPLETIVVTARGRAVPLSQTPGGVEVATEDDIFLAKKDSIADAIGDLPGISVSGDSAWGRDIAIRGMSTTSVVVLIDGKRVNTATDINARLGLINALDVERIEVLKGPVSSLYGSGSTGGVINIITRKGHFTDGEAETHGRTEISGTTNAAGGDAYADVSYDSRDLWLLASGAFSGHADYVDGAGNREPNSRFRDGQTRLAAGFKPTQDLTVELSALRTDARDVGIPGGPSTLPATGRVLYPRVTNTLLSGDVTYEVGGDVLKMLKGSLYYDTIERRVFVDHLPAATQKEHLEPASDNATFGGNFQAQAETGNHIVVAGIDGWSWAMSSIRRQYLLNGSVTSDLPTPNARQTSLGAYAEDTYALARDWDLNLGARLDQVHTRNQDTPQFAASSDDDIGWNVHAGATWKMGGPWSQNVLVASSYRAADLLERFKYINLSATRALYGNPDLKPEKTLYAEWGLAYRTPKLQGSLRLFGNKIYDYISEKDTSATRMDMTNIGEARIVGVELAGRWAFAPAWNLHGDLTALDGRDEEADEPLRYIAPVNGKLGVGYENDGWFATLDERAAAPQTRTPSGVDAVGGYAVTNAAAGYAFDIGPTRHKIALRLDNLFDARYRNYLANARGIDLVEPGFSATLSYSMEF